MCHLPLRTDPASRSRVDRLHHHTQEMTFYGMLKKPKPEGKACKEVCEDKAVAGAKMSDEEAKSFEPDSPECLCNGDFELIIAAINGEVKGGFLDLTEAAVQKSLGLTLEETTQKKDDSADPPQYAATHAIGVWAKTNGYGGIRAPSAQIPDGAWTFMHAVFTWRSSSHRARWPSTPWTPTPSLPRSSSSRSSAAS